MTERLQAPYSTPLLPFPQDAAEQCAVLHDSGDEYQQDHEKEERNLPHRKGERVLAVAPSTQCATDFTLVSDEVATDNIVVAASHITQEAPAAADSPTGSAGSKSGGRQRRGRRSTSYISLFLAFPDGSAERCAIPHESSGSYMQSAIDKGEMQNVHNAYMCTHAFAIGTQDALKLRDRARVCVISQPAARIPLRTMANLLAAISGRPEWAKHEPMMRTTAGHLSEMLRLPANAVPVDRLPSMVARFKDHLQGRHHRRNAVRSYVYYLRLLIRAAGELGAKAAPPEIPLTWQAIYGSAKACKCGSVVRYAVEHRLEPAAFGDEELDGWAEAAIAAGRSYSRSKVVKHLFRKAIFAAGLNTLMPRLSRRQRSTYGISVRLFPPALRAEVEEMMRFKQADFVAEAKGKRTKLRPESARTVTQALGRIYGLSVLQGRQITTLDELVSRPVITAFADFCINQRKLRPDPVRCALGAVRAAYSQFRGVDLPWFRTLLMSMPRESAKTIVRRKATKWVDYDELEQVPTKIRAAAERRRYSGKKLAIMRQHELLMSMVTVLAWRQRNLREPTLGTRADGANIFKEELHPLSNCARPDWVVDALMKNAHEKFWQVQFDASETKAHNEIEMILPQDIAALLDEWVQVHRPLLVRGADPGTLFLNSKGRAMTQSRMTSTVGELTLRYACRRVPPHIVRDILIVGFLKDNPEQYETAAKVLWHASPAMIRERYGANFDESFGSVAAERWLTKRRKNNGSHT